MKLFVMLRRNSFKRRIKKMNKEKWEELKKKNRETKDLVYVKMFKPSPQKSRGYKLRGVGITRKDKTDDKKFIKRAKHMLEQRKRLQKVM